MSIEPELRLRLFQIPYFEPPRIGTACQQSPVALSPQPLLILPPTFRVDPLLASQPLAWLLPLRLLFRWLLNRRLLDQPHAAVVRRSARVIAHRTSGSVAACVPTW